MDKEYEIAKAKDLRGTIIDRLYKMYPKGITLSALKQNLRYKNYNSEADIIKALCYLEDAEYIKLIKDETEEYQKDDYFGMIRLTKEGVNLAEGDITDTRVIMNE